MPFVILPCLVFQKMFWLTGRRAAHKVLLFNQVLSSPGFRLFIWYTAGQRNRFFLLNFLGSGSGQFFIAGAYCISKAGRLQNLTKFRFHKISILATYNRAILHNLGRTINFQQRISPNHRPQWNCFLTKFILAFMVSFINLHCRRADAAMNTQTA
jgi:hypothetical protein